MKLKIKHKMKLSGKETKITKKIKKQANKGGSLAGWPVVDVLCMEF